MQISVRRIDKTTILDVSGDIDLSSSPEVRKALLRELRDSRIPRVVVNLKEVRYIDGHYSVILLTDCPGANTHSFALGVLRLYAAGL